MNIKLIKALRKRVNVTRRFSVEDLGDGVVKLTCQTCGQEVAEVAGSSANAVKSGAVKAPAIGSAQAKLLTSWWMKHSKGGVQGSCTKCTQTERDEKYPLPPK